MRRLSPGLLAALVLVGFVGNGMEGLLVAAALVAALQLLAMYVSLFDRHGRARRRRPAKPAPDALVRSFAVIRDEIVCSGHTMREFDRTLRPRLTRILGGALLDRRGVRLDSEPDRARELVSSDAWALLDPTRPQVFDRQVAGVGIARLSRVVDSLEKL